MPGPGEDSKASARGSNGCSFGSTATTTLPSSTGPATAKRYTDIGRLDLTLDAEGDSTNRHQASQHPDVLMLLYLLPAEELTDVIDRLGYAFDPATIDHHLPAPRTDRP